MSAADRLGRAGHGQLIATPLTLALLAARGSGHLAVPVRQRFTLGTLRLELIPSGRGLGAAALHVDHNGRTVLYAGAVRAEAGGAGEPAEVRTCDAVVVAAPFGAPHHTFPKLADAIAQTVAWTLEQLAADRRPVLLVDTALDGLEVAIHLAAIGIPLAAGRGIREAAARIGGLTTLPPLAAPGKEPRAVIWLDADRGALAKALADKAHATALVSGRALDDATTAEAAFAWSTAADRTALLAWIESTSARDVFVTGPCAEAIALAVGSRARMIGPPQQMALFG